MDARFVYEKDEVHEIVLNEHKRNYYETPSGYRWAASDYYGRVAVELVKVEEPAKTGEQKEG